MLSTSCRTRRVPLLFSLFLAFAAGMSSAVEANAADKSTRWTEQRANAWYAEQAWPVGANFVPSTAINQLEMWQADTFDPATIDRELGWAADIGMNSMRVFLHDIPWKEDPEGFCERIDQYLEIADRHGIRTMFVLFDGVWRPEPKAGPQPEPIPRTHNSGWVQSPGKVILGDPNRHDELKDYVQGILTRYKDDDRVLIWDLFNEPDNANVGKWPGMSITDMPPGDKHDRASELLDKAFTWAREVNPSQPLTAGVWGNPHWLESPSRIEEISLNRSDVISFHTYHNSTDAQPIIEMMVDHFHRPLMCTEYMARGNGSTFAGLLPQFREYKIGAYNWGLVAGKSQTIYPQDSWRKKYTAEPEPWFHDVFRPDGTAYRESETQLIRDLTTDDTGSGRTGSKTAAAIPEDEIKAGLESHDRALFVKAGWIRDPYITLSPEGMYVLTGTTPLPDDERQHTDPYNTGLGPKSIVGWKAQVWQSPDLIHWDSLGTPFTLEDGIWASKRPRKFANTLRSEWRLWAPELHRIGDRWALVHTSPAPVPGANLSFTEGPEISGPWSNPMGVKIGRRHDPSLFQDDDGTWWLIWGATQIAPLKADFSGFAAKPTTIGPSGETSKMGHEGCLMYKIGGKYVLFGTGWSTGLMRKGSYNLYYAVADEITGPYTPRRFAGRFLGHGTPFRDQQGRWWCTAFYNANIPPIDSEEIQSRDLSQTAQTINQQGVTLVPMEVSFDASGEPVIRAKDPRYASPGPDESQQF
ncbi:family 43 glycosylhydrolase [Aeoliella sp. ICT_H6.2]|uniref:Family 43 glycosylhydrolase n=1 Tax=Aeoliella straminimaris TaxID=2954799 RepID=A0A9X2FEC9_9BACT|nr:family 43 glycosylhydrolase [Aeoliella straminimaris]